MTQQILDRGERQDVAASWRIAPLVLFVASGVAIFAFEARIAGYAVLVASLILAFLIDRSLFRDQLLVGLGVVTMSLVPITTDISWDHMLIMGSAMIVAVGAPYAISRWVFRDHAVRFPVLTGKRWGRPEWLYLGLVIVLGYLILPWYMIHSGVYQNWPDASSASEVGRLFLGTNALGIWDELFFICTAFALFRRHVPFWLANLLQAALFTSFLWELGFHAWGPLLIYPFALLQGYTFRLTKSLSYIVAVHLLFDFVLFLVLIHAHNREWFAIFLY
ncbi:type II CAAX prenyl endopeptidase Rce1 family protein [Lysobacter korlensis]|uniref:Type II CAAX prenyl endopeptidase Rce1 family protein n=1 Tax=Lysobacter korlensis TaxID=553636 RepID=A0ABV6RY90_9GAMM